MQGENSVSPGKNLYQNKTELVVHDTVVGKNDACCAICEWKHLTSSCFRITCVSPADRLKSVCTAGLCFACLKKGHITRYCEISEKCGKDGCAHKHHVFLHEAWASTLSS